MTGVQLESLERIPANDFWRECAEFHYRNESYYRGLLDQIGEAIGVAAFTCDDGTTSDTVLRAKLPGIVRVMVALIEDAVKQQGGISGRSLPDSMRPETSEEGETMDEKKPGAGHGHGGGHRHDKDKDKDKDKPPVNPPLTPSGNPADTTGGTGTAGGGASAPSPPSGDAGGPPTDDKAAVESTDEDYDSFKQDDESSE